ncbi:serine/threonine protein kinase [Vavraia culicis subsp. floridensis]|uniref:Serine/threonine protein kinase n=1 Tax=Vavraia culicis (isolate floridensis) TaxID=948595 RepID=L2GXR6_VAVCU|nr:serine/threonine protein kinase [Vavraia culicis subsp. floridensis]ELA48409.1 serine/threonine protein kinase [Vavraia culicis subsp. floridensis]
MSINKTSNVYVMSIFDEQFEMYEKIGYGRFGNVYRARYKPTGEVIAVKVIRKGTIHPCYIGNEVRLGSLVSHHGIVKVKFMFHNSTYFFIVMELLEGATLENLINCQRFTENEARVYVYELVKALHFLHSHHIMHRDIKPSNVMVCKTGIKIVDLGTLSLFQKHCNREDNQLLASKSASNRAASIYDSYNIQPTDVNSVSILKSLGRGGGRMINCMNIKRVSAERCGTLLYSAPEALFLRSQITDKVDVWSLGCLIYRMITGTDPFTGSDSSEVEYSILKGPIDTDSLNVSDSLKELFRGMFRRDHKARMSIEDVMASDWLSPLTQTYISDGVCVFCGNSLEKAQGVEEGNLFRTCRKCEDSRREKIRNCGTEMCFSNDVPAGKLNRELVEIKLSMWGLCASLDATHRDDLTKLFGLRPEAVDQIGEIKNAREVAREIEFGRQLKAYFGKSRGCFTLPDIYSYIKCRALYKDPNLRLVNGGRSIFKVRMFFKDVIFKSLDPPTRMIRGISYDVSVSNEQSGPKISLYKRGGRFNDFQRLHSMIRDNFERMVRVCDEWY